MASSPTTPKVKSNFSAKRRRGAVKTGKKSFFVCSAHEWFSDPEKSRTSQEHGRDVHLARMRGKNRGECVWAKGGGPSKTEHIEALAAEQGVHPITIRRRIKAAEKGKGSALATARVTLRELTKPPKEFFELKRSLIMRAANSEGPESDAFLESAAGLHSVMKKYTK